jgi:hypothetical protein
MKESDCIYEALYFALIEIRAQGETSGDKVVFHLADLFHNVPPQLAQVARGERTYAEVLAGLERKADEKGIRSWLDNVYQQLNHNKED